MRKLKIIRRKDTLGFFKLKVYMACDDGDTTINGIKCKQVALIKNGKETEIEISNDKVLLIAFIDKMSKEIVNDKILILEGSDDLTIIGSFRRENEILQGLNVFRFDEGIENTQKI